MIFTCGSFFRRQWICLSSQNKLACYTKEKEPMTYIIGYRLIWFKSACKCPFNGFDHASPYYWLWFWEKARFTLVLSPLVILLTGDGWYDCYQIGLSMSNKIEEMDHFKKTWILIGDSFLNYSIKCKYGLACWEI